MNMAEYKKVKDMTYREYCQYLQNKYGIGRADYMRASFTPNPKCSRTSDGLYAHHLMEDHAIKLSKPEVAKNHPFEWQKKESIVYCDALEHLFLHVLIGCFPAPGHEDDLLGILGASAFLIPELNDVYSGWKSKLKWQQNCHNLVRNDKAVYLKILARFAVIYGIRVGLSPKLILQKLCISTAAKYGSWSEDFNSQLYIEIMQIRYHLDYDFKYIKI